MPSKNDLSALKAEDKKILPEPPKAPEPKAPPAQGKVGRPKKSPKEKRNYKIMLSLTQAEGEKVRHSAGLAPDATYIYDVLKKAGIFR